MYVKKKKNFVICVCKSIYVLNQILFECTYFLFLVKFFDSLAFLTSF